MQNLKVLVVGGGYIATEKLEKLVDFTSQITVIALRVEDEAQSIIDEYSLSLHKRALQGKRLKMRAFPRMVNYGR